MLSAFSSHVSFRRRRIRDNKRVTSEPLRPGCPHIFICWHPTRRLPRQRQGRSSKRVVKGWKKEKKTMSMSVYKGVCEPLKCSVENRPEWMRAEFAHPVSVFTPRLRERAIMQIQARAIVIKPWQASQDVDEWPACKGVTDSLAVFFLVFGNTARGFEFLLRCESRRTWSAAQVYRRLRMRVIEKQKRYFSTSSLILSEFFVHIELQ